MTAVHSTGQKGGIYMAAGKNLVPGSAQMLLLRLLAQYGVCKLACGGAALGHEILGVAERVLNIEQFLRAHGYRSSLFLILSNFSTLLLSAA